MKKESKPSEKRCFIICPIGEEDSTIRKFSDTVLTHIIEPAISEFNYHIVRADKISEAGIITTQIIQHIVESELVIADLSSKNPNVFYELAIRHAIKKPLIQIITKGDTIPFDVASSRIIQFDVQDLYSVAAAKKSISNQLSSIESGKSEIDNPISMSFDLKILKESGKPQERSLADIMQAMVELKSIVKNVEKLVGLQELTNSNRLINSAVSRGISSKFTYAMVKEWGFQNREVIRRIENLQNNKRFNRKELEVIKGILESNDKILADYLSRDDK